MNKQKHRWSLNFTKLVIILSTNNNNNIFIIISRSNKSERSDVLSPPGYNSNHGYIQNEGSREVDNNLIVKKSWEIALAPLKQIPMNLFIMYMAGNSISILPIMMVGMLFLGPIKAIFSFNKSRF